MKMLIAGRIQKTEMGSDKATLKIAQLCAECGQRAARTEKGSNLCPVCERLKKENGQEK